MDLVRGRTALNDITALSLLLIGAGNAVTGILENKPLIGFVPFVGLFFAFSATLFVLRRKIGRKFIAWLYLAIASITIAMGELSDLTGPWLLCYSLAIFSNRKIIIASVFAVIVSVSIKAVIDGHSVIQAYLFIIGSAYMAAVYYILNMPRKKEPIPSALDDDDIAIVRLRMDGLSYKEIADQLIDMTEGAVKKRLERARVRYHAKSNEDLVYLLAIKGHIVR